MLSRRAPLCDAERSDVLRAVAAAAGRLLLNVNIPPADAAPAAAEPPVGSLAVSGKGKEKRKGSWEIVFLKKCFPGSKNVAWIHP